MEESKLEWRMYGLVPYNISDIQKGIQYGHAVQEFNNMIYSLTLDEYGESEQRTIDAFDKWRLNDKTFIILNGGTTNKDVSITPENPDKHFVGSLNNYKMMLSRKGIKIADFYEPDLGDQLTAVVFLADERVWNYEKYPAQIIGGSTQGSLMYTLPETDEDYEKRLGGEDNVWLRNFLKQFRLA